MIDYSRITKVRVLNSVSEVNTMIAEGWILLGVFMTHIGPAFVLGTEFSFPDEVA